MPRGNTCGVAGLFNNLGRDYSWQVHTEGRTFSWLAVYGDMAAIFTDDAMDHRKSETGPLSLTLGRKIGVEDIRHILRVNSTSRIAYLEHNIVSRGNRQTGNLGVVFLYLPWVQRHGQHPASFPHGMIGVSTEVHDNLMELSSISQHHAAVGIDILTKLYGGRNRAAQNLRASFRMM